MGGIRTDTRLEALQRVRRRSLHELDHARAAADLSGLRRLHLLIHRLDTAIEAEGGPRFQTFEKPSKSPTDHVADRLRLLGVTSHDVKVWAVEHGLVDRVRRGRIRMALVEAYARGNSTDSLGATTTP